MAVKPAQALFEVAFLVEDGDGDIENRDGGAGVHGGAPHAAALKGDRGMSSKARRHHRGVLQGSGGGFDERHVSRVALANMKALGGTCDLAVDVRPPSRITEWPQYVEVRP
ncbi:hypothetical protein [Arthrobacter sp. NA-172]|uniref:hypothetical protein n=1 Tax=Arthrobacter sp. NA-172 TaxID=3367524 RepID=UPI003754BD6E